MGGGGSSKSSSGSSPLGKESGRVSLAEGIKTYNQSQPLTKELLSQFMQAFSTGGIGAQIPIIQSAVGAAKTAGSAAESDTSGLLARLGLQGSPVAASVLGGESLQVGQQIAGIGPGIVQSFMANAPSFLTALLGGGTAATGAAVGQSQSSSQAQNFEIASQSK